ncbi:hypothetical protein GCM10010428_59580 [Actinosynnema pretiosum subsp. pretiosum]
MTVLAGDVELARYEYAPGTPQLESPKPFLHPVRTRGGRLVSLFRPHDHVWHKGIAWSLPHVGEHNFWGGPTYLRGRGYAQLDNNGAQVHRRVVGIGACGDRVLGDRLSGEGLSGNEVLGDGVLGGGAAEGGAAGDGVLGGAVAGGGAAGGAAVGDAAVGDGAVGDGAAGGSVRGDGARGDGVRGDGAGGGGVRFAHELEWVAQDGRGVVAEVRVLTAVPLGELGWALIFDTTMTNTSGGGLVFGSPTTNGRENAGYGGLFWRGPRAFTGGSVITSDGVGGDELRGWRGEWMAFCGKHDGDGGESLVLVVDHVGNPHHPPRWFTRSESFACLNPAPFFSEELVVGDGESVRFRYGVGIADGGAGGAGVLAEAVRGVLG